MFQRSALRILRAIALFALIAAIGAWLYTFVRDNPEDLPWTPLDLTAEIGAFTGRKIADLADRPERCRALLAEAGIDHAPLPDLRPSTVCGYRDGVLLEETGARRIGLSPEPPRISCPIAAGLALWEWHVVQPAALESFGQRVVRIEHLGGYGCRRMYGNADAPWSEHATADALDIAALILEDGTRISVLDGWEGNPRQRAFLRRLRDGACDIFATVLSPAYNAAHADHFHFDQAERGRSFGRVCR